MIDAKGKQPVSDSRSATTGGSAPRSGSGGVSTLMGSIAASAKAVASALDPRQADVVRQHHSIGSGSLSTSSAPMGSKAGTSSAAATAFQHTANVLETLNNTGSSSGATEHSLQRASGFREQSAAIGRGGGGVTGTGGAVDWDNFLASSESALQDDQPYQPPSMSSFGFAARSAFEPPRSHSMQTEQLRQHSRTQPAQDQGLESAYQAHLSQPMNLTPANHAVFLEYLKSTATMSAIDSTPTNVQSTSMSTFTTTGTTATSSQGPLVPVVAQEQSLQPQNGRNNKEYRSTYASPELQRQAQALNTESLFSNDVYRQQHLDGSDVLSLLESTSYSEFVDQIEAEGIDRHQHDRREFVYSEVMLGPRTGSLLSTLQLIQHLPSERQDIVQYLLQQGTYAEDVWSRPFGHDAAMEEARSLAATQQEQELFLKQQQELGTSGDGATTEEMERVLQQIVEDAKKEVKTGETNGRALNRLMMVQSHITMGTKL
ncbi:hypothetical protein EDD11_000522 [Mortierella claussenii]|nr:hypothetical protein EDD11_000522 [Mortierella claussenii]